MDEQSPRRGFRPRQFERARCLPYSKREMNEFPGGSVHKGVGSLFLTLSRRVVNHIRSYKGFLKIDKTQGTSAPFPTLKSFAVALSVKRARWHPTFGAGALRDRSRAS